MTRFARASGSKASNQRLPEDSTPWFLLKQQVTKDKSDGEQEQITDWKSKLDTEKKIEDNKNSVWCDFEVEKPKSNISRTISKPRKKKLKEVNAENKSKVSDESCLNDTSIVKLKKKNNLNLGKSGDSLTNQKSTSSHDYADLKYIKTKLKLPKTLFQVEGMGDEIGLENQEDVEDNCQPKKKKFKKSNAKGNPKTSIITDDIKDGNDSSPEMETENYMSQTTKENSLQYPRKQFSGNISDAENSEEERSQWEESSKINTESKTEFLRSDYENNAKNNNYPKRNNSITWKMSNKRERSSQPYNRRKHDEGDVKLEINGQEIWVTRLDGFYIKKEDAERIRQLEKDLLSRGVSNQEVRAVVKKERRNAEKALARQKKKVCFHCRKGGHTLSSCPKLEDNGAQVIGSGICYKCGSTEHTHFQCKVASGDTYKFATCFVCKQEGHISKQCPDNPRGMYPTGGGCRLCGDVTHFRRECPTLQAKSNKVTVGLIGEDIETLGDQPDNPRNSKEVSKGRKNKIIKFS